MEGSTSSWGYKEHETRLILHEHDEDDDDDDDEVFHRQMCLQGLRAEETVEGVADLKRPWNGSKLPGTLETTELMVGK